MSMFPGCQRVTEIPPNDAERIDASVVSQQSKIYAAEKLSKFFEFHFELKLFGNTVFVWDYLPHSNN